MVGQNIQRLEHKLDFLPFGYPGSRLYVYLLPAPLFQQVYSFSQVKMFFTRGDQPSQSHH